MKYATHISIKCLSFSILLCVFFASSLQAQKNIILDTDMGTDCDDALALSILHVMADKGEANILAVGSCVSDPYSAPTIDVINTYYGRPNIPVGALKQVGILAGPYFTREIAQEFPNDILNGRNAPDVISVYRQALAQQPNNSVTFIAIGPLNNLKNLLQSGADQYSSLGGLDLVAQKVATLTVMGGDYPTGNEWNFYQDGPSSSYVVSNWPTPITFSGAAVGSACNTGVQICTKLTNADPTRRAFEISSSCAGRDSWDPSAVLYAIRGLGTTFTAVTGGKAIVAADGSNTWQSTGGNMSYLIKNSCSALATPIDELFYTPRATTCNVAVTGISLNQSSATLGVGLSMKLTGNISPANACNKIILWSSSNTSVATVSNIGEVWGLSAGTVTITGTTQDGSKTSSCTLTVVSNGTWANVDNLASGWTWNGYLNDACTACFAGSAHTTETLNAYGQYTFTGTAVVAYCETWDGAGTIEILIDGVSKGIFAQNEFPYISKVFAEITGLANTSHTIRFVAKEMDNWVAIDYFRYLQEGDPILVSGILLDFTEVFLSVGGSKQLTASISPENAWNQSLAWTSSNSSIVTVDQNGLISAIAPGVATITATSADGDFTSSCLVTSNAVITGIESEHKKNSINVYPNPSNTGSVTIDFDGDLNEETAEVVIIDLMGRSVYQSGKLSHVSKLSVSTQGYANGSYIVKVSKGKERVNRKLNIGQ